MRAIAFPSSTAGRVFESRWVQYRRTFRSSIFSSFLSPVLFLAAMGLVIPNAPAVALARHPDAAGTAAATLGAAQFGLGAAVAPRLLSALRNCSSAASGT